MSNKWNENQIKAINSIGVNTLVSASAGSGKTAVMVERIIRLIKGERVDGEVCEKVGVGNLLVLAFSRAVAGEIKEKISEALRKEIKKGVDAEYLRQQLDDLAMSDITTVDAFCAMLVKTYFEEVGIDPSFSIADQGDSDALLQKAISQTFENYAESGDMQFSDLKLYFGNEKDLNSQIVNYYKFTTSLKDYPLWIQNNFYEQFDKPLYNTKFFKYYLSKFKAELNELNTIADKALEELRGSPLTDYANILEDDYITKIKGLMQNTDTEQAFYELDIDLYAVKNQVKRAKKNFTYEESELYGKFTQVHYRLKSLVKQYIDLKLCDKQSIEYNRNNEKTFLTKFLEVFDKVIDTYTELKKEDNKLDYADLEEYAAQILGNEEICIALKDKYKQICVDEYQDINEKQEYIISRVASDNNVFMVGDGKQSIFGFRNSDTQIFIDKYDNYKNNLGGDAIELNFNYRSEWGVLDFVNDIFKEIMTRSDGGVNYAEDAMFDTVKDKSRHIDNSIEIVNFGQAEKVKSLNIDEDNVYSVAKHKYYEADEYEYFEAMYIVDKISKLVGRTVEIQENNEVKSLTLSFSDIAILSRSRSESTDRIVQYIEGMGVPINSVNIKKSRQDYLIDMIINVLRVVNNFNQDIPLLITMAGEYGRFSFKELEKIRRGNEGLKFFHECVMAVAGQESNDTLVMKVKNFIDDIKELNTLSGFLPVSRLIEILSDRLKPTLSADADFAVSLECLRKFAQSLKNKSCDANICEFLLAWENNPNGFMQTATGDMSKDCVLTATVHQSKGLEYPVVFLIDSSKEFNIMDTYAKLVFDKDLGIAVKAPDELTREYRDTFEHKIISIKRKKRTLDEEMRLLYVALTRAKYCLYVTGRTADFMRVKENPSSYFDWLAYVCANNSSFKNKYLIDRPQIDIQRQVNRVKKTYIEKKDENYRQIKDYFESEYAYEKSTQLGIKYTVTAINRENAEEEIADIPLNVFADSSTIDEGIAYHKIMQCIDYSLSTVEEVENFIQSLKSSGEIEDVEINAEDIFKCIKSDIIQSAVGKATLREQEFMLNVKADEVLNNGIQDKILVQGVIDLVILDNNHNGEPVCVIVDFKKSSKPKDAIRNTYASQLELYAKATEYCLDIKVARKLIYVFGQDILVEI